MNLYVLSGIIAGSTTILAGIISILVSLGLSIPMAFSSVYVFSLLVMFWMQKSAIEVDDDYEKFEHGGHYLDHVNSKGAVTESNNHTEENEVDEVA